MVNFLKKTLLSQLVVFFNQRADEQTILKKKRLLIETQEQMRELVNRVEKEIGQENNGLKVVETNYIGLGGSNNLGFFEHKKSTGKSELITKIAYSQDIQREKSFLKWHQSQSLGDMGFAPEMLASGDLSKRNGIDFLTTEKLYSVKNPTEIQVWDLYERSKIGVGFFSEEFKNEPLLEGGSRIRNMLVHLVANQDVNSGKKYLSEFMEERVALLTPFEKSLRESKSALLEFYESMKETVESGDLGFVHGDFKTANMLKDSTGRLKLIDFQYYCKGFREWDLAFYLSKKKKRFWHVFPFYADRLESDNERRRLAFFYILAVLLHPKPEKFLPLYKNKIAPALIYLKMNNSNVYKK